MRIGVPAARVGPYMTDAGEIARQLQRDGYAVIPGLLSQQALTRARAELGALLDVAEWGSGFDGTRTKRAWAPLAVTRWLDQAALAPLVLNTVEQAIGLGTQFGITCAIQLHPGQGPRSSTTTRASTRCPATATS